MEKEIKQLKKIITDAIPEILELKFGCMLKNKEIGKKFRMYGILKVPDRHTDDRET